MGKYTIKQGDTLSEIALKNGTTVAELKRINGISNPDLIYAGDTIMLTDPKKVRDKGEVSSAKETSTGSATPSPSWSKPYTASGEVDAALKKANDADKAVSSYNSFTYGNEQAYNDVIKKILNREKFSYDLNGDALYQQYKDKYMQQGKIAMQDTMGQAAALTGGYGNSYAATAGNQAYQAHLENLNDIIPELYQMALDKYNMDGQELYNQYGLLSSDRAQQQGEWQDAYNRLVAERDYARGVYDSERNYDYGIYFDNRDFAYGMHRDDIADQQWQAGYDYQVDRDAVADAQWQKTFDESVRQFDEDMRYKYDMYELQKKNSDLASDDNWRDDAYDDGSYVYDFPEEEEEPFTPVKSQAVTNFQASVRTRNEFYGRSSPEKEKYKTYEAYLEGKIRAASDRLTEAEVATLIAYYGLENY